jgi:hypothetical protein
MKPLSIAIYVVIAIVLIILYLIRDQLSGFLKDQSAQTGADKPYSLSRTLFSFWTLLIFFAFSYIGIAKGELPDITKSILLLMGIASGTALASRTIDNIQAGNPKLSRIQDLVSEGFLTDILSDANGISITRFQTLAFNLIYGGVFISTVFTDSTLYPFNDMTLTLLGISSGTYTLSKIPESQPK